MSKHLTKGEQRILNTLVENEVLGVEATYIEVEAATGWWFIGDENVKSRVCRSLVRKGFLTKMLGHAHEGHHDFWFVSADGVMAYWATPVRTKG